MKFRCELAGVISDREGAYFMHERIESFVDDQLLVIDGGLFLERQTFQYI